MNDTLSLGESMVLFTATPGTSLQIATTFTKSFGGAESNFAIALARLGFKASWSSLLGADSLGEFILKHIQQENVNTSHVKLIPNEKTGLYLKAIHANDGVEVLYYRQHSAFSHITPEVLSDSFQTFIQAHRFLHLTGITPCLSEGCFQTAQAVISHFKAAPNNIKNASQQIIFDINIRKKLWQGDTTRERIWKLAQASDYVLGSIEEFNYLANRTSPLTSAQAAATFALEALKVPKVIIKLDAAGSHYFDHQTDHYVPAFKVAKIVDPVGAGDAFAAGVVSALLENNPIETALLRGNAMGAIVLSALGDIEPLPTQEVLKTFLASHTPQVLSQDHPPHTPIHR